MAVFEDQASTAPYRGGQPLTQSTHSEPFMTVYVFRFLIRAQAVLYHTQDRFVWVISHGFRCCTNTGCSFMSYPG
jgi:hypothetical protein